MNEPGKLMMDCVEAIKREDAVPFRKLLWRCIGMVRLLAANQEESTRKKAKPPAKRKGRSPK